jgi:hypothetical protein
MHALVARATLVVAVAVTGGIASGCSGPDPSTASPAASSSAHTATVPALGKGSTSGKSSASGKASTSGKSSASGKGSTARKSSDPRQGLPVAKNAPVAAVGFGTASNSDRARFRAVDRASAGLVTSSSVRTLTVAGRDVGAVAVYDTKPGLGKSAIFQDQYLVQLMNSVTGTTWSPIFVRADGQVMAYSKGEPAVAGWFEKDRVTLVYRTAPTPDLVGLARAVRSTSVKS